MVVGNQEESYEDRVYRHLEETIKDREGWECQLKERGIHDEKLKALCEFWIRTCTETIDYLKKELDE